MTDIDIDAIRLRSDRHQSLLTTASYDLISRDVAASALAQDVPVLLSLIAERDAEIQRLQIPAIPPTTRRQP